MFATIKPETVIIVDPSFDIYIEYFDNSIRAAEAYSVVNKM
jgi:hypothetical protein